MSSKHSTFLGCALALITAVLPSCGDKKSGADAGAGGGSAGTVTPPPKPAFDRIVAQPLADFGTRPGFIQGGMVYAAMRVPTALTFLRGLPWPTDFVRDLGEFASETGIDLRSDDLSTRFALAADGVVSMTLLRPIRGDGKALRAALMTPSPARDAIRFVLNPPQPVPETVLPPKEALPISAPPAVADPPPPVAPTVPSTAIEPPVPPEPVPPEPVPLEPPPPPPGPSAEAIAAAKDVLDRASAFGLHSRVVVAVTDPRPLVDHLRSRVPAREQEFWRTDCAGIGGVLCIGGDDSLLVVRGEAQTVTFDFFMFIADAERVTSSRREAVRGALAVGPVTEGPALAMRGDASAYFEARGLVDFVELDAQRRTINTLRWDSGTEDVGADITSAESMQQMAAMPMLFRGARLDVGVVEGDGLYAELRWIGEPGTGGTAALLAGATGDGDIPTIAGLCDGALLCFRSAGLPSPGKLAERFAKGAWAAGPDEIENRVRHFDEIAAMHVFVASWPNLVGAMAAWPEREAGDGPQATLARNAVEVFGRVEGVGGSLRSLSVNGRGLDGDYVGFLRTNATDSGLPRGVLTFAGQSMSEGTLGESRGPAWTWSVPDVPAPLTLVTHNDANKDGSPPKTGWIALVDGLDRMGWMLDLPREHNDGPPLYAEIPDLGRLLSAMGGLDRDLDLFRGYATGRGLRAMLKFDGDEPVVSASFLRNR